MLHVISITNTYNIIKFKITQENMLCICKNVLQNNQKIIHL